MSTRVGHPTTFLPYPTLTPQGGRGGSGGGYRGGRGGGPGGPGAGAGPGNAQDKKKKESILNLATYVDKSIKVKFMGGREGEYWRGLILGSGKWGVGSGESGEWREGEKLVWWMLCFLGLRWIERRLLVSKNGWDRAWD